MNGKRYKNSQIKYMDWQSQTLYDGALLLNPTINTWYSLGCRSISEHTFYWHTIALPDNAFCYDEKHESWA